ncbi:glycosyltransferase family 2 protein [Streptomyces sp. TS71-3]|uniref:glycosyltransferase family 2 protein n=1 Tax=Streptomyces sp. TS71-3 TaxID=2733862 RepID=UPI001BB44804|nr:glycosyltransferase family 2 protein [Streptomyces sp. TS71-3]
MGTRPAELRALIDSIAKQDGDPVEVVVVGNGSPVPDVSGLSCPVRTVEVPENLGIPGGRNVGIAAFRSGSDRAVPADELTGAPTGAPVRVPVGASTVGPGATGAGDPDGAGAPEPLIGDAVGSGPFDVDILLFLDDDGLLAHHDTAQLCREAFAADPELGIISFRIADPETRLTQRRHVPRLRASDPMRSSRVTTFLGGANAVRTEVIAEVGGLPGDFFYAHEETDLAWRALDAGWEIDYRSDLVLLHPTTAPSRHAVYHRMVARNRVWLARRNLPAPLVPPYLAVWLLLTLLRRPSRAGLRAWFGGFREGWTTPSGPRRPMKWRTVWRLTRLGRPPII